MCDRNDEIPNEILKQYSGKSEDELYAELVRATSEQKQEGEFDAEGLNEFEATIAPMLNEQQKEKLDKLLAMLRGENAR